VEMYLVEWWLMPPKNTSKIRPGRCALNLDEADGQKQLVSVSVSSNLI